MPIEEKNCTTLPFSWFHGFNGTGQCQYTTQNFSSAYSPAFIEESNVLLSIRMLTKNFDFISYVEQTTTGNLGNIQHGRNRLGVN